MMCTRSASARAVGLAATAIFSVALPPLTAQAPAGSAAATTAGVQASVGTVKSIEGGTLTVGTDKGATVAITLPGNVRVLQLAPGSTDLKTAQPAAVTDITAGDRVLVSARSGDGGALTALRVVLMKSGAIAENNAARQQDWQRRGSGGVVDAVDAAAGKLTVTAGTRKETVTTTGSTIFRRYAPGSVKFEDASLSKLDAIQPGDQVRVRGDKAADGTTIAADEIVSGAFRNVAGLLTKVDAGTNTVTINDLTTKKPVTVSFAADSDLRSLPPEMAARFAARGAGRSGTGPGGAGRPGGPRASSSSATQPAAPAVGGAQAANGDAAAAGGARGPEGRGGAGRSGDLSQVIARLPKTSLADLKPGEAVMVVASGASGTGGALTAITLLSGVEPLLAASSQGGANSFSISPWNLGGGGEGAAEGAGPQ